jgi:uracil-DNA glycosylase family protein
VRTVTLAGEEDFDGWRDAARRLAADAVPPGEVAWRVGHGTQHLSGGSSPPPAPPSVAVPRAFVELARAAIRHSDPERFALLYALLLRVRADPRVLEDKADPLVRRVEEMASTARHGKDMAQPALVTDARTPEAMMASNPETRRGSNALAAWQAVREEARGCTRCHLFECATQTVFGEGPVTAPLMFVGEQPGDQEDLAGKPFVGPAGQLFDRALGDAGIDRAQAYVTNAVKHFKFERRGKRRIHSKPDAGEIEACRWWIEQERAILRPTLTVALGATAGRSLFGKAITITAYRGRPHALREGGEAWVTVHPSFLLRVQDNKEAEYARFVDDLVRVRNRLAELA